MTRLGWIFFIVVGVLLLFMGYMLFQDSYVNSSLQEMRPIARGQFTILRDCYNVPTYYIDANPLPSDWLLGKNFFAMKVENRKEYVHVLSLKEGATYNLYVREGFLKNFYFVECVN